jgi:hypothetical protein
MNTYILPYSNGKKVWLEKVRAKSFNEAKNRFMQKAINDWDIDVPSDWDDFVEILKTGEVIIGKIIDVEEL